jgi:hypothetical protein
MSMHPEGEACSDLAWSACSERPCQVDEPTNHLDVEAIDGLANAIKKFKVGRRRLHRCPC